MLFSELPQEGSVAPNPILGCCSKIKKEKEKMKEKKISWDED